MGNATAAVRAEVRERLAGIVGEAWVSEWDEPLGPGPGARLPWLRARPADTGQVERIVALANETGTALVPMSSSGPHRHGGSSPLVDGAVVVDLRRMNRILRIDRRQRMVLLEPGVTYEQLVPVLAEQGLRIAMPLVPRRGKSVVAALLEREPLAAPRFAWSPLEPLRTLEVVWGSGTTLYTGNGHLRGETDEDWADGRAPIVAGGPGQLDFFRLLAGAQGAMGIATWASVKLEPADAAQTLLSVAADRLDDLVPLTYELLRIRFADELFVMDAEGLGQLLGVDPAALPAWTLVVGIGGGSILAREKAAGREADVRDLAARHGLEVRDGLAQLSAADALGVLRAPSPAGSWRDRPERGTREVFFLTTLDRVADQIRAATAAAGGRRPGVYLQPVHQGAGLHCELLVGYGPAVAGAAADATARAGAVGRAVLEAGGYFSRPYGEWADWVFAADPGTADLTRTIKDIFDPHNVMNPGKLCFPRGDH